MNRNLSAFAALAITLAAVFVTLLLTAHQLPPQVASHFNGTGQPDGWMLRNTYLWSMAVVGLGLPLVMMAIFYGIRYFPPSVINLPHRDFWLSPEHREETCDVMFRAGIWLAALQAALLLGVHLLVVRANNVQPARLSSEIWWLLAVFLLALTAWIYALLRRFRRPASDDPLTSLAAGR